MLPGLFLLGVGRSPVQEHPLLSLMPWQMASMPFYKSCRNLRGRPLSSGTFKSFATPSSAHKYDQSLSRLRLHTVHHRPGFSLDIRTWSSRTENAECVNKENLLGAHLADGAAYLYVDGTEYVDIFPSWDWRKVPGVLARQQHAVRPVCQFESLGSAQFVGGVEVNFEGIGGVVAMDFAHGPAAKPVSVARYQRPDPKCKYGLQNGVYCCSKSCNICGGKSCSTPPNNGSDCCVTAIAKNGRYCDVVSAPCNMNHKHQSYDPKETLTAKRSWFLFDEGMPSR